MRYDAHIHMLLDGEDWRVAIARHKTAPDEGYIRAVLARYRARGVTHLRDGGDRWGVCTRAARLAGEYGIDYKTPAFPIYKAGCYGSFIGRGYEDLSEYGTLVERAACEGADCIKVMISGIMDFDRFGVLTEEGPEPEEIRQMIEIAHGEGLSVMAHANGPRAVEAAASAGVDSVEHGAYAGAEALAAMAERGVVWVPTLSAVANLRNTGRFDRESLDKILADTTAALAAFQEMGGLIAPGSDAGAFAVRHGTMTEYALLEKALGPLAWKSLEQGAQAIAHKF